MTFFHFARLSHQVERTEELTRSIPAIGSSSRNEEAAWIRAAQRGDQPAFERLVRAYDSQVLRMAYNILRSEEDARDVFQESFLRVYRNLSRFRFECAFSTWLYRIVSNLCLDHLRKRKVRREESAAPTNGTEGPDRWERIAELCPSVDPLRQLLSGEVRSRLEEALEDLTPRERVIFEMRHYQGMRLRAIGDALGVTEEAAKNCLFRGTQKLRSALGEMV